MRVGKTFKAKSTLLGEGLPVVQAQLFPWAEVEALQLLSQLFALGVREPASRLLEASHAGLVSKLPAQSPVAQEPSSRMVGPGPPQRSSRLLRPEEQEHTLTFRKISKHWQPCSYCSP